MSRARSPGGWFKWADEKFMKGCRSERMNWTLKDWCRLTWLWKLYTTRCGSHFLDDHVTDSSEALVDAKMILFGPDRCCCFWVSIIKFYELSPAKVSDACRKRLRRLLFTYKSWMLFILSIATLMRMPEAYAHNLTVKSSVMSVTSYNGAVVSMLLPTADVVSSLKGSKPISIPANEVITSEDTEDYLEEDSEEDYETEIRRENESGESFSRLN